MKQITLALGMIALLTSSCGRFNGKRINGNGHMKTDERTVNSFKDVESSGTFNIILTQGPLKPVRIEADENLLSYIEVSQEGDKLEIREKPDVESAFKRRHQYLCHFPQLSFRGSLRRR